MLVTHEGGRGEERRADMQTGDEEETGEEEKTRDEEKTGGRGHKQKGARTTTSPARRRIALTPVVTRPHSGA